MLDARTREAEVARARADVEQRAAEYARESATQAKSQLQVLQTQLVELETKQTSSGLAVTLGDILFELGRSELKPGAERNLMALVSALREHPNVTVLIEGHTDSTGSRDYNLTLSRQRAEAIKAFLMAQGIAADRMTARGLGPDYPVASNGHPAGRQQNRRVDVIIQQPFLRK